MISPEVVSVVEAIRAALPSEREWSMMNSMPAPSRATSAIADAPASYLELLEATDGFICGPVVLFDSKTVTSMQFYAEAIEGSAIPLNQEDWYCVGVISDEPWFIKRSDESVWVFPDAGVTWWMSDRFEQADTSLANFFLHAVCGPSYLTLTGASRGDQWWQLLRHLGRL
ncbi:hypothetical protein AB0J85_27550 [Micromonospora echinofusca]|uniref:hypothetical protein n=1 Tax=Micromonospora echinofusca TaxID=47858 RepID=UPI003431CAF2